MERRFAASGVLALVTRSDTLAATTAEPLWPATTFVARRENLDLNEGPLDTDRRHNFAERSRRGTEDERVDRERYLDT